MFIYVIALIASYIVYVYIRYGREPVPTFDVRVERSTPVYPSYVANMLFSEPVGVPNANALFATSLDLVRRGNLSESFEPITDKGLREPEMVLFTLLREGSRRYRDFFLAVRGSINLEQLFDGRGVLRARLASLLGASISLVGYVMQDEFFLFIAAGFMLVFLSSSKVFGRFVGGGIDIHRRHLALKRSFNARYLEHDPPSVEEWDEMLVYAVALGQLREVRKYLRRAPEDIRASKLSRKVMR